MEPASLAVIDSELINDYDITQSLPLKTIEEGALSSLQLESVIKAAHRHKILLPNGERAGFFIGDSAGVGKGRQVKLNRLCDTHWYLFSLHFAIVLCFTAFIENSFSIGSCDNWMKIIR